jgi:hypothetical protein
MADRSSVSGGSITDGWSSSDQSPKPITLPIDTPEQDSILANATIHRARANSSSESEVFTFPTFKSTCTNVVRGGFNVDTRPDPKYLKNYPPPPNAAYDLTSEARNPKYSKNFVPNLDGATVVKESVREQVENDEEIAASMPTPGQSKGELLARDINWERSSSFNYTPGVSGKLWSGNEEREDFIEEINSGAAELEYCRKCKKNHIPPGPPITLQDRDTCYAYLPDWFPADKMDRPWDGFIAMINDLVLQDERLQGYTHRPDPDKPEWNLEYHDPAPEWRAMGRRGGWWKCRNTIDAPMVERMCQLCHRDRTVDEKATVKRTSTLFRKNAINDFVEKHMKSVEAKDRAIVEERIYREGFPQILKDLYPVPFSVDAQYGHS